MKSKNKPAMTAAERRHVERIAQMPCVVCGADGQVEIHEINQGQWFTALPLCATCHRHSVYGLHGCRGNWRAVKLDELGALNLVIKHLMTESTQ